MNTSNPVIFRPAKKSECRTIATLYSISSDGVADYVWSKLARPGEDILDVGQRRYEQEESVFSYKNCVVATVAEEVIGMLVAFLMKVEASTGAGDPVLAPYNRLEEDDSYYICGMSLFPQYRARGIGTKLLALAEEQAKAKELAKLSLIVFEQNVKAKRLYERQGYKEVAREPVVPHKLIHYTGDALLMVKNVG
jgi:ribosomal protein S18 acetylase RimI-like enzyme